MKVATSQGGTRDSGSAMQNGWGVADGWSGQSSMLIDHLRFLPQTVSRHFKILFIFTFTNWQALRIYMAECWLLSVESIFSSISLIQDFLSLHSSEEPIAEKSRIQFFYATPAIWYCCFNKQHDAAEQNPQMEIQFFWFISIEHVARMSKHIIQLPYDIPNFVAAIIFDVFKDYTFSILGNLLSSLFHCSSIHSEFRY